MSGGSNPIVIPNSSKTVNGWSAWGNHILAEQERLSTAIELLRGELVKVYIEIATLKVKSGVWGLLGGLIMVLVSLGIGIIVYIIKGGK